MKDLEMMWGSKEIMFHSTEGPGWRCQRNVNKSGSDIDMLSVWDLEAQKKEN